jgi:hypothetical protein
VFITSDSQVIYIKNEKISNKGFFDSLVGQCKKDEISVRYLLNICDEESLVFTNVSQDEVSNTIQLRALSPNGPLFLFLRQFNLTPLEQSNRMSKKAYKDEDEKV